MYDHLSLLHPFLKMTSLINNSPSTFFPNLSLHFVNFSHETFKNTKMQSDINCHVLLKLTSLSPLSVTSLTKHPQGQQRKKYPQSIKLIQTLHKITFVHLHLRKNIAQRRKNNLKEKCVSNETNLNYYSQLYHTLNKSFAALLSLLKCVVINLIRCHIGFILRYVIPVADFAIFLWNFRYNLHIQ